MSALISESRNSSTSIESDRVECPIVRIIVRETGPVPRELVASVAQLFDCVLADTADWPKAHSPEFRVTHRRDAGSDRAHRPFDPWLR